jgi:hypothetical protein
LGEYRDLGGAAIPSTATVGFWSYAHQDNQLDRGHLIGLAEAVASEFELMTGEELGLFVDSERIEWGDEWRRAIDTSVPISVFFIAVITPRYLRSAECRREFVAFLEVLATGSSHRFLLPILYTDTPAIVDRNNDDEIAVAVRRTQYEDWRDLRLAGHDSPDYRRAVHRMADRLVTILRRARELS